MEKEVNFLVRRIMMKKKLLALIMGTSLVLAACGGTDDSADKGSSSGNETTTADGGDAATAKLYENKCSACHGQDLTGGVGPDLTKVGSRLSQAEMETIINEGKNAMPGGLIDEKQAVQMSEWLASKK